MHLVDRHPRVQGRAPAEGLDLLHELLCASLDFAPEYAPHMASHLPMALAALHGLGASPEQMRRYFSHESANLVRLVVKPDHGDEGLLEDWTALRGRIDSFAALRVHFDAVLADTGRDACLRATLPGLLTGIAGVAFHGAIRTAHAVECGHDGELAMALAYWAARWTPLPMPGPADESFSTPAIWLDALDERLRLLDGTWRPTGGRISLRMRQATGTSAYEELAGAIDGFGNDLGASLHGLALAGATRYAATRNFTVLHIATTARALRVLAPWIGPAGVPTAAWHAVAAASLASGLAFLPSDDASLAGSTSTVTARATHDDDDDRQWSEIRRLACETDDDHVIKLVHAMVDQHRVLPSRIWLNAAKRAVWQNATNYH